MMGVGGGWVEFGERGSGNSWNLVEAGGNTRSTFFRFEVGTVGQLAGERGLARASALACVGTAREFISGRRGMLRLIGSDGGGERGQEEDRDGDQGSPDGRGSGGVEIGGGWRVHGR